MKYNVDWLNELAGTQLSVNEMADRFTRRSFEVEEIIRGKTIPEGVVVGKILEVSKHPDADNLSLTRVAIDPEEKKVLDIVCGAKNIAPGDVVPVATVGTILGEGFVIKKAKIRGEVSFGMLCAEDELGLGDDHSGIVQLPKDLILGTPVSEVFSKTSDVIDLDILASRGHDALSHIGIARELIAIENRNQKITLSKDTLTEKEKKVIDIQVEDTKACTRYIGALLEGIDNTKKTPDWMVLRLASCGIGSINIVTDITNYVMLELGQPLHAFDAKLITDKRDQKNTIEVQDVHIHVRNAKRGEKITLLDKKEYELGEDDIVIANKKAPLALAGIMGGLESATNENTTTIFLESACFNAYSIRMSRMRHKITTESSYRFERDLDPNLSEIALVRALELFRELLGIHEACVHDIYPKPIQSWEVKITLAEVKKLLGVELQEDEMKNTLERLDLGVEKKSEGVFCIAIPTFRRDIQTQEDIIEEIGRIYGYENIKPLPLKAPIRAPLTMKKREFIKTLKDAFIASGYDEILTYSFYGQDVVDMLSLDAKSHFSIKNPLNNDQKYFRTRLLPNMCKAVAKADRRFEDVRIFEVGSLYERGENNQVERFDGIGVISSSRKNIDIKDQLFAVKGQIEAVLALLTGEKPLYDALDEQEKMEIFHPTQSMDISIDSILVGFLGIIHPFVAKKMKLPKTTVVAFLMKDALEMLWKEKDRTYKAISPFPWVFRDISLNVGEGVSAQNVQDGIKKAGGELLQLVEMFDIYEKDEEKSFAYHLAFGSSQKTLSGEEVDKCMENIQKFLQEKLQASLKI
jgi:phenylalanyl-tRNA synthetase beta chain